MKIITTFEALPTISASSADPNYPVANVVDLDPGKVWQASTFSAGNDAWITIDFGAAKSINAAVINNGNFANVVIQGNATDSWLTPSFSQSFTLAKDDCQVRKGYFALTAFNYRFMRVFIAFQSLDDSALYPFIGNLIVGTASTLKVAEWAPQKIKRYSVFQADGGSYVKTPKGKSRHVFQVSTSSTLADAENILWDWLHAIVYEDLGSMAGTWLVYHPNDIAKAVKSINEVTLRFTLEERV